MRIIFLTDLWARAIKPVGKETETKKGKKVMKTNVTKKLGSLVLALAIAFTAVFATATPVEAATNYTTVYSSTDAETAYANTEVKNSIYSYCK